MSISDSLNRHLFLSVSLGQFIGLVLGGLVALFIMAFMGQNIVGWVLAALLAFLVIHLFHAQPKQKLVMAAVTAVVIIIVGGAVVNPGSIDKWKNSNFGGTEYIKNPVVSYDSGDVVINAEFTAYVPEHEVEGTIVTVYAYSTITMMFFGAPFMANSKSLGEYHEFNASDGVRIPGLSTQDLHYIIVSYQIKKVDDKGTPSYEIIKNTGIGITDANIYTGNSSGMCWSGAAYCTQFFAAIFVLLTLFGWIFRRRINKTRSKMEEQGRLYPQGYGRCSKCNAIILPGEVECRKCGTYIDRPDQMKRKKTDYFRCTNCGQEVPKDADSCPKCGAVFSGEETTIVHGDGTSEEAFECPDCGEMVPLGKEICICPRCGKRFQK